MATAIPGLLINHHDEEWDMGENIAGLVHQGSTGNSPKKLVNLTEISGANSISESITR